MSQPVLVKAVTLHKEPLPTGWFKYVWPIGNLNKELILGDGEDSRVLGVDGFGGTADSPSLRPAPGRTLGAHGAGT